jgi:hypothetical protein
MALRISKDAQTDDISTRSADRIIYSVEFIPDEGPPNFEGTMDALMDAVELHYQKALDYDGDENEFGLKGEILGITRKVRKLKRLYWDGKDPLFEGGQEMLMDLIGNALLMLRMQKAKKDKYLAKWRKPVASDRPDFPMFGWGHRDVTSDGVSTVYPGRAGG